MTTLVKAKVSAVVPKQTPEFVREEHDQFIKFLQAYYEWLEMQGNAGYVLRELENTFDIDKTVDDFVDFFKKELLVDIPVTALTDKRVLAKQINDMYRTKGTKQSYELLFRIMFDEEAEIYYPKEDVLRASDGKYDRRTVIKVIETKGDAFHLIGQTITQPADEANGIPLAHASVESVIKFSVGVNIIAEVNVNKESIVGTFIPGAKIIGLDNLDDSQIEMVSQTLISGVRIDEKGSYYSIGDEFTTDAGSGTGFLCEVANVKGGSVQGIHIIDPGYGYQVGSELLVNATDTNGYGLRAIIEEVDQDAFLLEGVTDALYSSTTLTYDLGDPTMESLDINLGRLSDTEIVANDVEYLLLEDGGKIIPEESTSAGIKKIKVINGGANYNKPPIVTAPGIPGFGAKLVAYGEDIGRITGINITDLGVYYEAKPSVASPVNAIIDYEGSAVFAQNEPIYSEDEVLLTEKGLRLLMEDGTTMVLEEQSRGFGYYQSFDTNRSLLKISPANTMIHLQKESGDGLLLFETGKSIATENSGEFTKNQTIRGLISGARARIISVGHAEVTPLRGAVGSYVGQFIGADGKISEASKKMQDNLFYQDFSYVVKVGQSIDKYRDAVKKLLHPVGLALFGEVRIQSFASGSMPMADQDAALTRLLSFLLLIVQAKMRGITREIKLVYPMFFNQNMRLHVLEAELLPTILLPHQSPYIYLLDLRSITIMDWWTKIELESEQAKAILRQHIVTLERKVNAEDVQIVGNPRLGDLEKWKFFYPPYEGGTKNSANINREAWDQPYPAPNAGYWDLHGNTQIKDFADISVYDIINNPKKKVNFCFEAHIDIVRYPASSVTFDGDLSYITMDDSGFSMDKDTQLMSATDIYLDDNVTTMDSTD
jgi:hypothetical protein